MINGIDRITVLSDLPAMDRAIAIAARWDGEAHVWIATGTDVPGLVIEADTWSAMVEEVKLVLPELLELSGNE
ncbi:MAG: DUF1902 domain-containing protein [Xanthobacteraceae bacterium]